MLKISFSDILRWSRCANYIAITREPQAHLTNKLKFTSYTVLSNQSFHTVNNNLNQNNDIVLVNS